MQVAVERRPTLFFLVVLAALFLVMTASIRTTRIGETRTLFERGVMWAFSPVPRLVNWAGTNTADMYHGYLDMRRAVAQNFRLHNEVENLTRENLALRQSEGDLARMRSLLNYSEQFDMPTILARVIMLDTSGSFKSIILDQGSASGIEINDAVVNAQGLIGRVVLTTRKLSKVQIALDNNAAIGSLLERSRRQGVTRGDGTGMLRMDFVPSLTDVTPGDSVLTAGTDGLFPKGIPVGTVVKVDEGKDLFKSIRVAPAVDFSSLEDVIVLHTRKVPADVVRYQP
jgi:rod shape-determining protein MreC